VLLDASDGTSTWGAIGVHENVIEASWDALVDSLEAACCAPARPVVGFPLARPVLGEAEERPSSSAASGQRSWGRGSRRSRRPSRPRGARHASAVSSGNSALHLALRRRGRDGGDEVINVAVLLRGQRQRDPVRAGPAGFRDIDRAR
jgi:hypothetical protein